MSAEEIRALRAKMREELLDAIAFQLLGYKHLGPLGRWAVNRVIEVWCRPLGGPL